MQIASDVAWPVRFPETNESRLHLPSETINANDNKWLLDQWFFSHSAWKRFNEYGCNDRQRSITEDMICGDGANYDMPGGNFDGKSIQVVRIQARLEVQRSHVGPYLAKVRKARLIIGRAFSAGIRRRLVEHEKI
jgi:hypothetical protein